VKIWDDPDFEKYPVKKKLLFIYLCTNPSTSESGIYAVTPKKIADNTGIEQIDVIKILKDLKNVMWDEKMNYVYIRRFRIYNGGGRPDIIKSAIATEFLQSYKLSFWNNFIEDYPDFKNIILATGKPLNPTLPLNPIPNSNSISISNSISKEPLTNGYPTVSQPLENDSKLPEWIDITLWNDFLEMRRKIKKPATEKAKKLLIVKLQTLKALGNDPRKVLEQSIINNYQGLFDLNQQRGGTYRGTNAAYKQQPAGTRPPLHTIDGDAEAPPEKD